MTADLDTLLTALYVLIDDHVIPSGRRRPGRPKKLSDAELVCLAVAQVLLGARSEHHWLRLCYARLGHLFPYLPKQPGYHKRVKAAAPLLAAVMDHLAREAPSWHDQVRLIDATPVPCGTSRETVRRSELAGWAGYGYCAAHSRWYWGLKLYLITTPDGMPVTWCLASPRIGEREVAAELLAHAARHGSVGWIRQWIESVNDTLKGQLDLERHGGRTTAGVYARITQRLLAMAATIWHNWATAEPVKRSLIAYDN